MYIKIETTQTAGQEWRRGPHRMPGMIKVTWSHEVLGESSAAGSDELIVREDTLVMWVYFKGSGTAEKVAGAWQTMS
ncbi:hypothetical protein E2C01_074585 [Portunus trituberculatus]|uniref:Uncharacterized protein n=1 Tax=Portunus trituberculatus TaxID=210409 RepID=A0A5B7I8E0_PORTR|nr:hypothetical protein [Portunus trituberculatus]